MRSTLIQTINMIKARANATRDEMLHGLAATLVIMNQVGYGELDCDVWDKDDFELVTKGM